MSTNRLKVLCVDDNHDIADTEVMLLTCWGFDARACYDGSHAIIESREFCPDVYLIDLNMPGMNGWEVARAVRTNLGGPPPTLIAITAKSEMKDHQSTTEAGFDMHLVKPVEPKRLLSILAKVQPSSMA